MLYQGYCERLLILDLNLFIDAGTVFDNQVVPTSSKETVRSSIGFGFKFYVT